VNHTLDRKTAIPAHIERMLAASLIEPTRRLARRFGNRTERWLIRMEETLSRS
jgi:hypothetical protein